APVTDRRTGRRRAPLQGCLVAGSHCWCPEPAPASARGRVAWQPAHRERWRDAPPVPGLRATPRVGFPPRDSCTVLPARSVPTGTSLCLRLSTPAPTQCRDDGGTRRTTVRNVLASHEGSVASPDRRPRRT